MIRLLAEACGRPIQFTIVSLTAEDDRVVAEARSETVLVNGEPYSNTYIFVIRVRDGRMASIAEHYNALIVEKTLMPVIRTVLAKNSAPART
jgi:ketosteroid isomerase-like protein